MFRPFFLVEKPPCWLVTQEGFSFYRLLGLPHKSLQLRQNVEILQVVFGRFKWSRYHGNSASNFMGTLWGDRRQSGAWAHTYCSWSGIKFVEPKLFLGGGSFCPTPKMTMVLFLVGPAGTTWPESSWYRF